MSSDSDFAAILAESDRLYAESVRLRGVARRACYAALCAHLAVDRASTEARVLCEGQSPSGGWVQFSWGPDPEGRFTIIFGVGANRVNAEALPQALEIWHALLAIGEGAAGRRG